MILTAKDIPGYGCYDSGQTIKLLHGYSALIKYDYDTDCDAPWDFCDGHGPVSDWTTRDKAPGELVLSEDRNSKRFYDYAGAIRIAKRDGWDTEPYRTGTKGERAHRAVMADYEYLRQWANDQCHYLYVTVELYRHGDLVADDSCGGIESYKDYWREHAAETINGMVETDREKRTETVKASRHEFRERRYWACRDVVTQ